MDNSSIPPQFINDLFEKYIGKEIVLSLKFKKKFRESIELFVHYLMTYCEEIKKEKGNHYISISTIKEALGEIEMSELIEKIEKEGETTGLKKRKLSEYENEKNN